MKSRARAIDPVKAICVFFTVLAAGFLLLMTGYLVVGGMPALQKEGLTLLTGRSWSYRRESFGALAMLYGTVAVSSIALVLAAPVGLGVALFSSELVPQRMRLAVKLLVELLAGVPSVIYGLLGVLFLRPIVTSVLERAGVEGTSGDSILTAGLLLAVMVLPTFATLADDALQSVPAAVRDAARGLGLTRAETILSCVVPRALPGLLSALLLALGRALGETTAVFLVVGRAENRLPESLFSLTPLLQAGQTITSKLGGAEPNIAVGDPLHMGALLSLALVLLVAVVFLTLVAQSLRQRLESGTA